MAKVLTAKELLSAYNILDPKSRDKHAHYEFQAFAYKLAHDLNDLANLKIYMMLAKKVERSLMERAYSYALDAESDNRGRLFMWKIKDLRREVSDVRNRNNFTYEYSIEQLKIFRDKTSSALFKRENRFDEKLLFPEFNKKENKVLFINCASQANIESLIVKGYKIFGIEISRTLKRLISEQFSFLEKKLQPKFVSTDFLSNKFKDNYFDFICLNENWLNIPLKSENAILENAKRILKKGGKIQLLARVTGESEEWKKFTFTPAGKDPSWQSEGLNYLHKTNSLKNLEKLFKDLDLKILENQLIGNERLVIIQKI